MKMVKDLIVTECNKPTSCTALLHEFHFSYLHSMKQIKSVTFTLVSAALLFILFVVIFMFFEPTSPLIADGADKFLLSDIAVTTTSITPTIPKHIRIPAIGVDAHIQQVGFVTPESNEMGAPTNFTDVAWFSKGPKPGAVGSAVITGHLSGKHIPKGVFYDLRQLQADDEVIILDENDSAFIFRVVAVKTYNYADDTSDIFRSQDGNKHLNLITCAGDWVADKALFNQRTVVFTDFVGMQI